MTMSDDPLRNLLRGADAGAPTVVGTAPDVLTHAVRQHAVRRQHQRRVAGVALLIIVGLTIAFPIVERHASESVIVAQHPSVGAQQDGSALAQQAEYHERVAAALARLERTRDASVGDRAVDPYLSRLQIERNRAALILVDQGDRLRRRFSDDAAAAANYRQAARLFPESPAAEVAGQRLQSIQSKGNES
jgi:hypothetical protein